MSIHPKSLHLSDADFVHAFEAGTLSPAEFAHADHIRLARLYVVKLGPQAAARAATASIRRFADLHGAGGKYHETITRAWISLVAAAVARQPSKADFEAFGVAEPALFAKDALAAYYSPGALAAEAARREFIPPDRNPLPVDLS